jgi:hypothetical protein
MHGATTKNNNLVQLLLLLDLKRHVLTFALYFCDCGSKTLGLMELLRHEMQLLYVFHQPVLWRNFSSVQPSFSRTDLGLMLIIWRILFPKKKLLRQFLM